MIDILNALIPVFAVIVFGYCLKRTDFLHAGFWPSAENLAYYFLLPILLFINIAAADFSHMKVAAPMAAVVLSALCINATLVWGAYKASKITRKNYTTITQGSIQTNAAYLGLPIALSLYGQEGLILYSMMLAMVVPIANFLILGFLVYHDPDHHFSIMSFAKRFFTHPLIIGCVGGLIVSYTGLTLPIALSKTLDILAGAAITIGLVIVGGALDMKATKGHRHYIAAATIMKLCMLPIIAFGLTRLLSLDAFSTQIALLYTMLPAAAYAYLLAKKHNGNAPLMAGMIVTETVVAAISMPIMLLILATVLRD